MEARWLVALRLLGCARKIRGAEGLWRVLHSRMSVRLQLVGKQMGGYRVHPMHAECIAGNGRFCTRRRALGAADRAERRLQRAGQRQLQAAIGAPWHGDGWVGAGSGFSAGWGVDGSAPASRPGPNSSAAGATQNTNHTMLRKCQPASQPQRDRLSGPAWAARPAPTHKVALEYQCRCGRKRIQTAGITSGGQSQRQPSSGKPIC